MRIPSGKTDQKISFVAFDSTDAAGLTLKPGLSSFTVYRMRNGGTPTVYTTPTVAEVDSTNMPGVYTLLIDEDTTIASTSDSEEMVLRITATGMYATTRDVELYRRDTTSGQTITVANGAADADIERIQGTVVSTPATAGILDVNVKNIDNDAASASGTVTFPNATLASTTNITAGTITTATNVTTVNGLAANVITAAATASDFGTEVASAVWDMDATGHQTQGTFGQAIGDPVADTNTIFKAVVTDATGATVGVDVVAVKAETASIQSDTNDIQTRLPAALVSGRIDASVGAMATDVLTAAAMAADAGAEIADAVWDEAIAGHAGAGSTGEALSAAGSAGDPWTTALPGAYVAGTAGSIIGNLNDLSSADVTAAVPTANANADALLDRAAGVETGLTVRQAMRLMSSALFGKVSGFLTSAPAYRDFGDTKDRITATTTTDGRTAVTTDAT